MLSRGWEIKSMKFQFYIPQTFRDMLGYALQSKRKINMFYTGDATLLSIFRFWGSIFQHYRDCSSHFTVCHKFWEDPRVWKSTAVGPGCDVQGSVCCTTWYTLLYWRYWCWCWKTVLCGDYDKLPWNNHHSEFLYCPILLLPDFFFPHLLIIHKYHRLPTQSQDLLPGNPACSRTQRKSFLCVHGEKKVMFQTHSLGCTTACVASLFLTFQDHLPPGYFGKTVSHQVYSSVISLFTLSLLSFLFIAPGSSTNGNSYLSIGAFYVTCTPQILCVN